MSHPLHPSQIAARRALEADLVSGALELSDLAEHGIPEARREHFVEAPDIILDRLVLSVRPWDLSEAAGALWARLGAVWTKRRRVGWDDLAVGAAEHTLRVLAYCRDYGMGLGLHASLAAERLLLAAKAHKDHERALAEAVDALEERAEALRGVTT